MEKSIIFLVTPIFEFSKLEFLTSSYHNSNYTEPIDMIFTKKCNYFSRATRRNHSFLSQSQLKGCFCNLNEVEQSSLEKILVKIWIQSAKTPHLLGLRQKWLIPSCCLWKVVTFFGKEHVNWSSISGDILGRSWTIKFIIFLVTPILSFPNSIFNFFPSLLHYYWTNWHVLYQKM